MTNCHHDSTGPLIFADRLFAERNFTSGLGNTNVGQLEPDPVLGEKLPPTHQLTFPLAVDPRGKVFGNIPDRFLWNDRPTLPVRKNRRAIDHTSRLAALGRLQLHAILRQLDLSVRLEILAAIRDLPQHPSAPLPDPHGGAFSEESFRARQAADP